MKIYNKYLFYITYILSLSSIGYAQSYSINTNKEHQLEVTYNSLKNDELLKNAFFYHKTYQYPQAIHYYDLLLSRTNPMTIDCFSLQKLKAQCYFQLGNYGDAIIFCEEAANTIKKIKGENTFEYADVLSDLGYYYWHNKNLTKGLQNLLDALKIYELQNFDTSHNTEYTKLLFHLSDMYCKLHQYSQSLIYGVDVQHFVEENYGIYSPFYAKTLSILAYNHCCLHNYQKSIELGITSLQLLDKLIGKSNYDYINALSILSYSYLRTNNITSFQNLWQNAFQLRKKILINFMLFISPYEYNFILHRYLSNFEIETIKYALELNTDNLNSCIYDELLLSKSLAIIAITNLRTYILQSRNPQLINEFISMSSDSERIGHIENVNIRDSLEIERKRKEMNLLNELSRTQYTNLKYQLTDTWQTIKSELDYNDIAIEFCSYQFNNDSTIYLAMTLKKTDEFPKLHQIFIKHENSSNDLSPWPILSNRLQGVKNIYFTPSNILYKFPIENLPYYGGKGSMSDHFNMFRLSSTRELTLKKNKEKGKDAAIFGGMKYDTSISNMSKDTCKFRDVQFDKYEEYNPYLDSLSTRFDKFKGMEIPYLKFTKDEADDIFKTINDAQLPNFTATEYTDTLATETAFKSLSGKRKKVIHIATHGFYYKESDAEKYRKFAPSFEVDEKYAHRYVEDKQLTRSGLYFSGADNKRQGKDIPEGVDDGILTAQEISLMDLRGCDLVVLSACQTGQGDIGSDGVFGLQRGFKKAGVNSILMTLDKVDDQATSILMKEFYKNYIQGKSKHESLTLAQKLLREYKDDKGNTPYSDPSIWGSFILLDALD